jgi:hypothetical protein
MNINANIAVTGEITAKFYDQTTLNWFESQSNKWLLKMRTKFPKLMRFYRLGKLKRVDKQKNVICNAGFNALIRHLINDTTYTGYINKMALGTGTPTPAATDTKLQTETYRNTTASGTVSSNIAYCTAYFTETECSGTYTEFGNFIDGTDTADTGQIWSHKASISWVKNSSTCLVVSCKYTFASV